jgi:hypothetical protein
MMRKHRRSALAITAALALMVIPVTAEGQTRRDAAAQQPQSVAPAQEKCLRALDGSCTKPLVVEGARLRAIVVPSVRVSYLGTPAGTIGGDYIPFERLFQDDPKVFGLPTNIFACPCGGIQRSK